MEIDVEAREVRVGGERVTLTATEWRLLQLLVANTGWSVPHDRLAGRVWERDAYADLGALRVFIRRLRTKLGDDAGHPRYVETVRGVGYRLLTGDANSMSQGHTSAACRKATQQ